MPDVQPTWPEPTDATGDAAVDALVGALPDLPGQAVSGHARVYAALHDGLLAELKGETAPGSPVPGDPRTAR